MAKTAQQLVTEANERVRTLTPDEVAAAIEDGSAVLVDVREPEEVQREGMIPGAVPAARGMLEFWADPASAYHRADVFDPERRLILYCATGGRSALAADVLQELGYRDVAHLGGGLRTWAERGRPVTAG